MEQVQVEKEKISKEQFISIWKKTCADNTMKDNEFEFGGSAGEPYHSILIFKSPTKNSEVIHFDILLRFLGKDEKTEQGMYSCEAKIIFDNYIEYQTIDLEQNEYEEMVSLFTDAQTRAMMRRKNQIVEERRKNLESFLNAV